MRKVGKVFKWVLIVLLILLVTAVIVIQTSFFKNFVSRKATAYLKEKIKTEFRIGSIDYSIPNWIELNGLYIEDEMGKVLVRGKKIRVDLNMIGLISGKYEINKVLLDEAELNLSRKPYDSLFNYQFIVNAFVTKDSTAKLDTGTAKPLHLDLKNIEIKNAVVTIDDKYSGMQLQSKVVSFTGVIDKIDLERSFFDIKETRLDRSNIKIRMLAKTAPPPGADSAVQPSFSLQNAIITRSSFIYEDSALQMVSNNVIDSFKLNKLNYETDKIKIDDIVLDNSNIKFANNFAIEKVKAAADTIQKEVAVNNLTITVGAVKLSRNKLTFRDTGKPAAAGGFDPANIQLTNLAAFVKDIKYNSSSFKANIENIALAEAKGFQVDTATAKVSVTNEEYKLDDILIKTPNSYIQGNTWIMPATFSTNPTLDNEVNFINTKLSLKDIELINPAIVNKYKKQLGNNNTLYINVAAKGNAQQFNIQSLSAHTNTNEILLHANGWVGNLHQPKNLQYDLAIHDLLVTRALLLPFVNKPGTEVNLPPSIRMKGKMSGNTVKVNPDVVISSAFGVAMIKGTVAGFDNQKDLSYNLRIAAKQLETGRWINKDSLLGKLTGNLTLKGHGTDYKTATATSTVNFSSFVIKKHEYNNIFLHANAIKGLYQVDGNIDDDALQVDLRSGMSFRGKYPSGKGFINVGNANFGAMGFSTDTLQLKTMMKFDIVNLEPSGLKALVRFDSTALVTGVNTFLIDSMIASGLRDSGLTKFALTSPIVNANMTGDFTYDHLEEMANFYKEKYTKTNRTTRADHISKSNFDLAVVLQPHPMLLALMPGLFFDKNILIKARVDNEKDSSLTFDATAPLLVYNTNRIVNLNAAVNGLQDSIKYKVTIDSASSGALQFFATSLSGGYSNNTFSADLLTKNEAGKDQYEIAITGLKNNDDYRISLSDPLLLNYKSWDVNKSNQVIISKAGFNIQQLEIQKQQEKISVTSISQVPNAPLKINVDRFALSNITGFLNKDSILVDGNLNAAITVGDFDKKMPTANGTVGIDSLQYQRIPVGNVLVNARTIDNSGVSLDGSLTGNNNKVTIAATYNQQNIDANILLEPITLQTLQAFSQGFLAGSKGDITGKIVVNGPVDKPVWNGNLQFNNAVTTVAGYGTQLKIDKQQINLSYPQITFPNFTIKDSLNQPIVINGSLTQSEKEGFITDLNIKTTNFTALANTAAMNSNLYGTAIVDLNMQVTGPAVAPDISGSVALKEKSNITVVRKTQVPSEKDREGVMKFVDMDTIRNELVIPDVASDNVRPVNNKILNYNLNIDISKDAKLNIIVDPITRDELQVQGSGQLNAGVMPNGDVALTGAYNLSKGSYQLNYQFIKRKFVLQEGSSILLSGDPTNAEADITAIYEINAVPYDLLGNELGGISDIEAKLYRQKLPFEVVLNIKGHVLQPQLSFNIRLKEKVAGVNAELSTTIENKLQQIKGDEAQMNKEVFALLIMGRFIGDQSKDFFASSGTAGGLKPQQIVKESVSRFLSEAVNQLAAGLIKGVDLDVNLKTVDDYSSATQRTDLSVGLTRRMLDDRLTITVGKSFTVEGDDPVARGQNNENLNFLPDISTNYKLSKDGKYAMRLYRRNQYEAILDGYFTETGLAFTFSVNYDKFKDLFKKKK
jgi:translocation and assembly module TamB